MLCQARHMRPQPGWASAVVCPGSRGSAHSKRHSSKQQRANASTPVVQPQRRAGACPSQEEMDPGGEESGRRPCGARAPAPVGEYPAVPCVKIPRRAAVRRAA